MNTRPKKHNAYNTHSTKKRNKSTVVENTNTSNFGPVSAYGDIAKKNKDNIKIKRKNKKRSPQEASFTQLK